MARGTITAAKWRPAATGDYSLPLILTGGQADIDPSWQEHFGAGGVIVDQAGLIVCNPTIEGELIPSSFDLIDTVLRASYPKGTLAVVQELQLGDDLGHTNCTECLLNRMALRWRAGSSWTGTFDFLCRKPVLVDNAGLEPLATTEKTFMDADTTITLGGSAVAVVGADVEVNNNVVLTTSADAKTSGEERLAQAFEKGLETLGLSYVVKAPPDFDPTVDLPAHNIASVITISNAWASGTDARTFTYANLAYARRPKLLRPREDGDIEYSLSFRVQPGSLTIATPA